MRKLFLIIIPAIVVAVAGSLTGCKKHDIIIIPPNHIPAFKTISYVISNDSAYSLLDTALDKAGLSSVLNDSSKQYTLFAPDNDAFAAAGISQATIDSMSVTDLRKLLEYHVINGTVNSSKLADSSSRKSVQGTSVFPINASGSVYVNGIKIAKPDIVASNGYIQGIKTVLTIPTQSISELISGDSSLSLFVAASKQGGRYDSIGSPGVMTVFAPSNSAFTDEGYSDSIFALTDSVSKVKADSLVKTYIVKGSAIFTSAFSSSMQPKTLSGDTLILAASPASVKLKGSAATASMVSGGDKIATNGVLHVIDRVLKKE